MTERIWIRTRPGDVILEADGTPSERAHWPEQSPVAKLAENACKLRLVPAPVDVVTREEPAPVELEDEGLYDESLEFGED